MNSPVVRLHLSESSFGPSPAALAAYQDHRHALSTYPDPGRAELTTALADQLGLDPRGVLVGNGSDELVLLSAMLLGDRDRPGLCAHGTFPGYRVCLEQSGRGALTSPADRGVLDLDAFVDGMASAGVAYVCNPHNPSGRALSRADMDTLVRAAASTGTPLVFDEAYMEFAPAGTPCARDYLPGDAPIVALRTFSKAWGLAALRIGYAFGAPDLLAPVREGQGTMPFSANAVAQAAALASLRDQPFVESVRSRNRARVEWFTGLLDRHGFGHLPTVTNFVAVEVADSAAAEARLATEYGILTRDAGRFGMPGHLRVSMSSEDDMRRLVAALCDVARPSDHAEVTSSPRQ